MTKNNASKTAIRERMQQTGESYCVAMRNLESPNPVVPLNVIELGEDTNMWFVEGTADIEEAKEAILKWFKEVNQPFDNHDVFWIDMMHSFPEDAEGVAGDDWFWSPINPEYPEDEAVLKSLYSDKEQYNGEQLFSGVYVSS